MTPMEGRTKSTAGSDYSRYSQEQSRVPGAPGAIPGVPGVGGVPGELCPSPDIGLVYLMEGALELM